MGYSINFYLSRIVDFILPPRCINCGRGGSLLCVVCQDHLIWLEEPLCKCCGEPVANKKLCVRCQKHPLRLEQLRAALLFTGIIPKIIHQFKYNNTFGLVEPLGRIMVHGWARWSKPIDVIIPIPLHPQRLQERGYNQSALLAKPLANSLRVAIDEKLLIRTRHTKMQAKLNAEERKKNVEQAFQVQAKVHGLKILLIDDVCTTGATLDAAASSLLSAGAKEVSAYCLARASSGDVSKN